jgi:threonine/homoserine/homoserine lactone efflux protein
MGSSSITFRNGVSAGRDRRHRRTGPSLLPQFGTSFGTLIAHGLVFSTLTLAWLAFVVVAGDVLAVPRVRRALDAVTGVVLIAFGVRLATEHR